MYQPQMPMQMGAPFPHQSYGPFGGIPTFGYPIGFRPPTSMSLSSVIGQPNMNERTQQRQSPFDRNFRQSPSPPNTSAIGPRHTHKDVKDRRSMSPEVNHGHREMYNSEKNSSAPAEASQPQRDQKRTWRNKEKEQREVYAQKVYEGPNRDSDRRQHRESDPRQHRESDTRQHREGEPQRSRYQIKEFDEPKDINRPNEKDQRKDRNNRDQGVSRSAKKFNDVKQTDSSTNSKVAEAPKARNYTKEKERPKIPNSAPKNEVVQKEVTHKEGMYKYILDLLSSLMFGVDSKMTL